MRKRYCEMITGALGLGADSLVVELASNDGYLLQHFLPLGVPVLGIEPAANVAQRGRRRRASRPASTSSASACARSWSRKGSRPI